MKYHLNFTRTLIAIAAAGALVILIVRGPQLTFSYLRANSKPYSLGDASRYISPFFDFVDDLSVKPISFRRNRSIDSVNVLAFAAPRILLTNAARTSGYAFVTGSDQMGSAMSGSVRSRLNKNEMEFIDLESGAFEIFQKTFTNGYYSCIYANRSSSNHVIIVMRL